MPIGLLNINTMTIDEKLDYIIMMLERLEIAEKLKKSAEQLEESVRPRKPQLFSINPKIKK